ncbi:oxidative stress-responsive serine-rich protein 1 [Menidia menidia]
MEAGGKDAEEDTLQTAFKKLRVDAESLPAAGAPEAPPPRAASRPAPDGGGGAKAKLGASKDNWHCCMRKTSRGASRSQRRRRSKSPILQPPKFSYCGRGPPLAPPGGGGGVLPEPRPPAEEPRTPAAPADHTRLLGQTPPPVFGEGTEAADFRALSELPVRCKCARRAAPVSRDDDGEQTASVTAPVTACVCSSRRRGWDGVEVYSFTGLRGVISECERGLPGPGGAARTGGGASAAPGGVASAGGGVAPAGSPRSCSEQARAYVDDITIEDLSGYMEFYLYIPKKMSHMAEMMYT